MTRSQQGKVLAEHSRDETPKNSSDTFFDADSEYIICAI